MAKFLDLLKVVKWWQSWGRKSWSRPSRDVVPGFLSCQCVSFTSQFRFQFIRCARARLTTLQLGLPGLGGGMPPGLGGGGAAPGECSIM